MMETNKMQSISLNPSLLLLVLSLTLLFHATTSLAESDSDRVAELLALQSQSRSGVIHLDDRSLHRFLTSAKSPRSYSLLIFFDATQLHDKQELHLRELRFEFDLVAQAFLTNNRDTPSQSKLFFCDIEFKESQSTFALFGVNSLPHVRHVGPHVDKLKDSEPMEQSDLSRMAESMAEFVQAKTKLTVGHIERPPILSKRQLGLLAFLMLLSAPFFIKKLIAGDTLLNDSKVWLAFAVSVYFFSVSGSMHNIIRKMPLFMSDQNDPSKIVFFYQGSGMQLGAEGFAVGFLYNIVGLSLALVTHVLVHVKNRQAQRGIMIVALFLSFWAVKKVVYLDNWKTGYGIHGFWPSSWK